MYSYQNVFFIYLIKDYRWKYCKLYVTEQYYQYVTIKIIITYSLINNYSCV